MNEMKAKALEKLMMILDDVLGEDVAGRMKGKEPHEMKEEESEEGEYESSEEKPGSVVPPTPVTGSAMAGEEETEEEGKAKKPAGIGIEVQDVKVAAMPRPGLMKKMGKKLA